MIDKRIKETLILSGQLGLSLEEVRVLFRLPATLSDETASEYLRKGEYLHRLENKIRLHEIQQSSDTSIKDFLSTLNFLRGTTAETIDTGGQELLYLLRSTVPDEPEVKNVSEEVGTD
ncbi:hypothetical protein FACS1894189_3720 [Planctomycetales bacterium]|nr:hypothetical protein FACS1894189_3720 [Planctomycetales bacterium]